MEGSTTATLSCVPSKVMMAVGTVGDCGDSVPAAVRVRHTDGRGDQSITALTGVLLLY